MPVLKPSSVAVPCGQEPFEAAGGQRWLDAVPRFVYPRADYMNGDQTDRSSGHNRIIEMFIRQ